MPFMNFPVHSYTCCSDRHASPYSTFISRWMSMGFAPSLLKKRMTGAVLVWCMLQAGPPSLHYYCAVVLHSCIVLPPVDHSSNHAYHCCQLTRQSTRFRIFITHLNFAFDSPSYICGQRIGDPWSGGVKKKITAENINELLENVLSPEEASRLVNIS